MSHMPQLMLSPPAPEQLNLSDASSVRRTSWLSPPQMWEALRSWVSFKPRHQDRWHSQSSLAPSTLHMYWPAVTSHPLPLTWSGKWERSRRDISPRWKIPRAADSFFFSFLFFFLSEKEKNKPENRIKCTTFRWWHGKLWASSLFPDRLHNSELRSRLISFHLTLEAAVVVISNCKERRKKSTVPVSVCVNYTINLTFTFWFKAQTRVAAHFKGGTKSKIQC